jgi:hypothetical protein
VEDLLVRPGHPVLQARLVRLELAVLQEQLEHPAQLEHQAQVERLEHPALLVLRVQAGFPVIGTQLLVLQLARLDQASQFRPPSNPA